MPKRSVYDDVVDWYSKAYWQLHYSTKNQRSSSIEKDWFIKSQNQLLLQELERNFWRFKIEIPKG